MADDVRLQGELQAQVMAALWRIRTGTVEQVRDALPPRYRGAYTTVQTVMNRLWERGMLSRARHGRSYVYQPRLTEAQYLSGSISRTLAGASSPARNAALADLLGGLDAEDLSEIQRLARRAARQRRDQG